MLDKKRPFIYNYYFANEGRGEGEGIEGWVGVLLVGARGVLRFQNTKRFVVITTFRSRFFVKKKVLR